MQHLNLLESDGEARVHSCIREVVDNVLWGFLCLGEKGAVISNSDEFLSGFHVFVETLKVVWQDLCCLIGHDAEGD